MTVWGCVMKKIASFSSSLFLVVLLWLTTAPITAQDQQPAFDASGARLCAYQPGISVPAQMPAEVLNALTATPFPTTTPPAPSAVSADVTARQLTVHNGLWNAVNDHYVYADFRGRDWAVIGARYQSLIEQGLSDEDFYAVMQTMINELGDDHSYFQSPAAVQAEADAVASQYDFVGIGALFAPIAGTDHAAIMSVFADSPVAEAGLLPHDTMLKVDGGPIRDERGISRTRGPEGSSVTITIQRPGEAAHEVTLTRRRVSGMLPIDYCLVPTTRIAYIFLPTLLDETMDDQLRAALQQMTAAAPLDGLVLDNRMNGGGLGSVTQAILSLFTTGTQGHFVSRAGSEPLDLQGEDLGGSQTVPLVVLVDRDTVSYGEILSGVLRLAGRAIIVGGATLGNVERLRSYEFEDGSRAWLASETFQPLDQASGVWEDTGIIPDVLLLTRWDLFTEATDPALAKAIELLMQ